MKSTIKLGYIEAILYELLKFVFNNSFLGTLALSAYVQLLYKSMQHITITTQGYLEIPFEMPISSFELLFFFF